MGFKHFVYANVIISRVIELNKPGFIINNVSPKFSSGFKSLRFVFTFKDLFNDLYLHTYNKLGREKAYKLFYKIAKKSILLSLNLVGFKKLKLPKKFFLRTILLSTHGTGIDFTTLDYFNKSKEIAIIKGKYKFWPFHSILNGFFAGMISAYCSSVFNKNIEAKYVSRKGEIAIRADKNIKEFCPINKESLQMKDYFFLNFPRNRLNNTKMKSFKDLVEFGKITMDKEDYVFCFKGQHLFPSPMIREIATDYFKKEGCLDVLEEGLTQAAEKLAPKILESKTKAQQLKELETILCAFGWGFPHHKITKDCIEITFVHIPYTDFGFESYAYELKGYLNYICGKKLRLKKIETGVMPPFARFIYSFK